MFSGKYFEKDWCLMKKTLGWQRVRWKLWSLRSV